MISKTSPGWLGRFAEPEAEKPLLTPEQMKQLDAMLARRNYYRQAVRPAATKASARKAIAATKPAATRTTARQQTVWYSIDGTGPVQPGSTWSKLLEGMK